MTPGWTKRTYEAAYARQMEDWLDWAWEMCMDNRYFYKMRGTGPKMPRTTGVGNQSSNPHRTNRKGHSNDDATSIDFGLLYRDWAEKVRQWERAVDPTLASRPAKFTKKGRRNSTFCYVLRAEAIYEFNLLWDFMTDQGLYPPGFSPIVESRKLRSRTTGR